MVTVTLDMLSFGEFVRARREALGLAQVDVARAAGVAASNLAAIESGARNAGPDVRERLERALEARPSELLQRSRAKVLDAAARHGVTNVRVFGSVARGTDRPTSDVDLLVDGSPGRRGFPLVKFKDEVEVLLTIPVDVVVDSNHESAVMERAHREAVPL